MDKAFVFMSFSVDDVEAAKDFYVNVLGYELGAPMTEDALKIVKGGQRAHIYPKSNHTPASFTLLNFKVDDIEQAIDQLTKAGVKFEHYDDLNGITTNARGIAEHEGKRVAWFTDPAGNIHALHQG